MTAGHLAQLVRARLGAAAWKDAQVVGDTEVLVVDQERWLPIMKFLRADPDALLEVLADLFAIDRGAGAAPRFEVRAVLRSPRLGYRAHVVLDVDGADPSIPTLTGLFLSAEALERELFEMMGVAPDGHPHPRTLLLYPGFVGHPLRRDYRAHKEQPLVPLLDDVAPPIVITDAQPADANQDAAKGAAT
jgi:NADH-quinone oxidoreductase subunit C